MEKNLKKLTTQEKANRLANAFVLNEKIAEAIIKVKPDRTIAKMNRIYRYMTAPTIADVELGLDEIKAQAEEALTSSCKRIAFICGEMKRFDGTMLISPIYTSEGKYKKVEDMSRQEKRKLFDEYRTIDWLIKAAADEYVK